MTNNCLFLTDFSHLPTTTSGGMVLATASNSRVRDSVQGGNQIRRQGTVQNLPDSQPIRAPVVRAGSPRRRGRIVRRAGRDGVVLDGNRGVGADVKAR